MADPLNLTTKIRNELFALNAKQRATRKGLEIAKLKSVARTPRKGFDIEILSTNSIEGGIEVFARAWHPNGKQVGFGKDGTVEIERFRIFNPPILVDDINGDIILERQERGADGVTVTKQRKLREDAQEAILQVLEHNLSVMKNIHGDELIVRGKIGNTTSTFYPDAHTESTSVDGSIEIVNLTSSGFAATRGAASGTHLNDSGSASAVNRSGSPYTYYRGSSYVEMGRSYLLFDTSALGDGDTISSAVLSLYVVSKSDGINDANSFIAITTSSPASNTGLALSDWSQIGGTRQHETSQDKDITGITTSAYTDWTLNATGIGNISKTGVSKFGAREGHDLNNVDPAGGADSSINFSTAEQTGTTQDPKLVVEHSSSTPVTVTPAAQVATFSLPASNVLRDNVQAVGAQVITTSIPAYTVSLPKVVAPAAQVATFSVPAYTVDAGGNITVAVQPQTITASIPTYSVLKDWVQSVNAQVATFNTNAPTIATGDGVSVAVTAQVLTASIPAYSIAIEANTIVAVNAVVATFILPTLQKVGAIWRKIARSTDDVWTRTARNSN